MEAVGSKRAALLGVSEGGPLSLVFAATYPERAEAIAQFDAAFADGGVLGRMGRVVVGHASGRRSG
mgnify:CR=1 FL=1